MSTKIIDLKKIDKEAKWVVRFSTGHRVVGTHDEVSKYFEYEDDYDYVKDIDLAAEQPEDLKPFFDMYFEWIKGHKYVDYGTYYKDIYLVDVQKEEEKPEKRIWTEDEIKNLIQTNDIVLYGALKKLYACQTEDEQDTGETKEHNGVGFNGVDAPFLSSVAEFLLRNGFLTDKQKFYVRKKLVKYNKQLTKLANA